MKRQPLMIVVLIAWAAAAAGAGYTEPREALNVGGGIGRLEGRPSPALARYEPEGSLSLNFAYRFRPRLAVAFDIEGHGQDYATPDEVPAPSFGTVDERMNISTVSMALQGVYSVPIWRTRLHLGAGAGLYRSRLTIGGSVLGIPGRVVDRTDNDFGTHLLARWDARIVPNWWLGAEYRSVDASADFGRWSGGDIDVGGVARYVTLRRQFDPPRWSPSRSARS